MRREFFLLECGAHRRFGFFDPRPERDTLLLSEKPKNQTGGARRTPKSLPVDRRAYAVQTSDGTHRACYTPLQRRVNEPAGSFLSLYSGDKFAPRRANTFLASVLSHKKVRLPRPSESYPCHGRPSCQ